METAVIVILILLACGCAMNQAHINGTILADGGDVAYSRDGKVEGYWVPTDETIARAAPAVLDYIEAQSAEIYAKLERYRCQYVGIVVAGKKRIYCNFFEFTDDEADWKERFVFVFDGGDMYFQLEYDVDSGGCLNFEVNGEA